GGAGSAVLGDPFGLGTEHFEPAIITVEPFMVLDRHWLVVIASPLSDIDAVVGQLFRRAVFWAVFVSLSMAAILVSTAVQMIRGRMRLERVRHEVLQRELAQAREIQLAWLPERVTRRPQLEIATMNHPATQVSGDFYNWFDLPDGRTAVAIGDV